MNNFERKFGKFSVSNLTMYIIIGKIFVFILSLFNSEIVGSLYLLPSEIMNGQVWRLITYMFVPQSDSIFFIFEILMLYWIGTGLEAVWGSFKYSMYYLGSVAGVAVAAVLAYFIGTEVGLLAAVLIPGLFTYTLFLPFAWYYGEEEIRVMFIMPIKVKYLAVVDALLILRLFVITWDFKIVWMIFGFSMINLFAFYAYVLTKRGKQKVKYADFRHKINKADKSAKKKAIHKCAICGITEQDDPGMSFRYCSKCEGDYEYCQKHLNNHTHHTKIIEFKRPE